MRRTSTRRSPYRSDAAESRVRSLESRARRGAGRMRPCTWVSLDRGLELTLLRTRPVASRKSPTAVTAHRGLFPLQYRDTRRAPAGHPRARPDATGLQTDLCALTASGRPRSASRCTRSRPVAVTADGPAGRAGDEDRICNHSKTRKRSTTSRSERTTIIRNGGIYGKATVNGREVY